MAVPIASIPGVADNQLVLTTWGQAVANELNDNCVKYNGTVGDGTETVARPGTFTGSVVINALPALKLKATGEQPYWQFESVAGTRFAYLRYLGPDLKYNVDIAGGAHRFTVNEVTVGQLDAAGLDISGALAARNAILARNDNATTLVLADYSSTTSGAAAHAFVAFYPDATSTTAWGTKGGHVGFNGNGLELQADIGDTTVQSVAGSVRIEASSIVTINPADALYVGKTAANEDTVGTELFTGTHATASVRGQIRNTTAVAGATNMRLSHRSAASAVGQKFISFFNDAGSELGSISQTASGITINGDTLVADLQTKVAALEAQVASFADLSARITALEGGAT